MASKKKTAKKSALSARIANQAVQLARQLRKAQREQLQTLEALDMWKNQYRTLEQKRNMQGEFLVLLGNALDAMWEPLELRVGDRSFPAGCFDLELVDVGPGVSIRQHEHCPSSGQTRERALTHYTVSARLLLVTNGRLLASISPEALERLRRALPEVQAPEDRLTRMLADAELRKHARERVPNATHCERCERPLARDAMYPCMCAADNDATAGMPL